MRQKGVAQNVKILVRVSFLYLSAGVNIL